MAPEPIQTAYFINLSRQSVCRLHVYPLIVARQRLRINPPIVVRQSLGKTSPRQKFTLNNRRIFGRVVFFAARVLSRKESRRLILSRTFWFFFLASDLPLFLERVPLHQQHVWFMHDGAQIHFFFHYQTALEPGFW
jgi:hypothetical protein